MSRAARAGLALRFGHSPRLSGSSHEHLPACRADLAQRSPVDGYGGAATGALDTIFGFIEVGLLDAHVFPVHVELVGDNHGQAGLYTLTNFGILSPVGGDPIGVDPGSSAWRTGSGCPAPRAFPL